MKQETKELVEFIKDCVFRYQTELKRGEVDIGMIDGEEEDKTCDKAITFLNSLSETESHLCRGGYIQDRNGTPCCDGDTILINAEFEATLKWIVPKGKNPDNMPHFGFQWKCDANIVDELPSFWIKKVTK